MPLQDHFHSPWKDENPWGSFHSSWIDTLVRHLNGSTLPPRYRALPTTRLEIDLPSQDVFEVRVFDDSEGMRLVAAIELVSPRNKDRPESRHAFVSKCAAYLQEKVGLLLVDVVTSRSANLHQELVKLLSASENGKEALPPYTVSYCNRKDNGKWRLDIWPVPLQLGQPLPIMPLWLASNLSVPVDLEKSYVETCQVLRIR